MKNLTLHAAAGKDGLQLSIILVNWNTKELVRGCLESIYKTTADVAYEIWVVDNASTDGSVEMIQREFPGVRLISNGENLGFARANNLAIRECLGDYVCLINTDVELLDNCLERLFNYLQSHPNTGVIAPRILNPDGTLQLSCYGHPTFWNSFCYALGLDKFFPKSNLFGGMYRKYVPCTVTRPVDVISGCFCIVRRKAFECVGLLDENLFMYMEDFDWCKRFGDSGWEVVYCVDAEAIHYGGGSSSGTSDEYWMQRSRAMSYYWQKYHGRIGECHIRMMLLLRLFTRMAHNLILWLVKPSRRAGAQPVIRQSKAGIYWLLNIRAPK